MPKNHYSGKEHKNLYHGLSDHGKHAKPICIKYNSHVDNTISNLSMSMKNNLLPQVFPNPATESLDSLLNKLQKSFII